MYMYTETMYNVGYFNNYCFFQMVEGFSSLHLHGIISIDVIIFRKIITSLFLITSIIPKICTMKRDTTCVSTIYHKSFCFKGTLTSDLLQLPYFRGENKEAQVVQKAVQCHLVG